MHSVRQMLTQTFAESYGCHCCGVHHAIADASGAVHHLDAIGVHLDAIADAIGHVYHLDAIVSTCYILLSSWHQCRIK